MDLMETGVSGPYGKLFVLSEDILPELQEEIGLKIDLECLDKGVIP